jgi:hypothetical protein
MSDLFEQLRALAVSDNYQEFINFWTGCAKAFVDAYVVHDPAYVSEFYQELAVVLSETCKTNFEHRLKGSAEVDHGR